jgi:hypothetical protein
MILSFLPLRLRSIFAFATNINQRMSPIIIDKHNRQLKPFRMLSVVVVLLLDSHFLLPFSAPCPGATHVYSTLLWYSADVPLAPGAHDGSTSTFGESCRGCVLYWLSE